MGFAQPKISPFVACVTFCLPKKGLKREFESQPCVMAKRAKNPKASPRIPIARPAGFFAQPTYTATHD